MNYCPQRYNISNKLAKYPPISSKAHRKSGNLQALSPTNFRFWFDVPDFQTCSASVCAASAAIIMRRHLR